MSTPLKNRDEVKNLINALTAIHTESAYKDTLAEQITDNLVFRKKVTATDTGTGAKTVDFADTDYLELTATGNITISFTNISVGEVKLLKVAKAGGVTIAFSGAEDQTPVASAVSSLTYVYYSVYRQDTSGAIIVEPISKVILQATETIAGIAEVATDAEVIAGTDDTRIVTPKKINDNRGRLVYAARIDWDGTTITKNEFFNDKGDGTVFISSVSEYSATTLGFNLTDSDASWQTNLEIHATSNSGVPADAINRNPHFVYNASTAITMFLVDSSGSGQDDGAFWIRIYKWN